MEVHLLPGELVTAQPSHVNECGVLTQYTAEVVASLGRSYAAVNIAMDADRRYRVGVSMTYSYGGFGSAPSMDGESFETSAEALDAGIALLLRRWHTPFPSDPASVQEELRLLREQVLARERQPSLI